MKHTRGTVKRLLSAFLCLVMLLALAPVAVFAEGEEPTDDTAAYTVRCHLGNDAVDVRTFTGKVGETVVFADNIDGYTLNASVSGTVLADGSLVLDAYYTPIASAETRYKEIIYVDGVIESEQTFSATVGTRVYASIKEKNGYNLDESKSITSAVVEANEATVLRLYFVAAAPQPSEEISYCKITFKYEGLLNLGNVVLPYGGETEAQKGVAFELPAAETFDGHKFVDWYANGVKLTAGTDGSYSFTPSGDTAVVGKYEATAQTHPYTVNYYLETLGGSYVKDHSASFDGVVGTNVTAAQGREIKDIPGFNYNSARSTATASVGHTSSTEMNLYYTRASFTVTYMVDGEQSGTTETYKFGERISLKATPTKKNFTFVGWNCAPALGSGNTMPASNVVASGEFSKANSTYKVITYRQNIKGQYEIYSTQTFPGDAGDKTTVKAPAVDGFKAKTVVNKTIAADGSTVVKVYYDIVPDKPLRPLDDPKAPAASPRPSDEPYSNLITVVGPDGELTQEVLETEEEPAESAAPDDVEAIGEEETPLASGESGLGFSIIPFIILGILIVAATIYIYIRHKKETENA